MSALSPSTAVEVEPPRPRSAVLSRLYAGRLPIGGLIVSRVLIAVAGAIGVSTLHPHSSPQFIDQMRSLGWLGNLLSGSTDRFDSGYYLAIAQHGYGALSSGKVAFFPVYPMLIKVVALVTFSPVLAGVLVSGAAFAVALLMLHRLTELEFGCRAADLTVLLLCFAPLSFFFTAIYSESIFLALTVGCLYAARLERWPLACVIAAGATLTRPTGIVLIGALAVVYWRSRPATGTRWRRVDRSVLWLAAPVVVLAAWMVALTLMGYGLTGEFHVEHTIWHRATVFPLEGLVLSIIAMLVGAFELARGATLFHPSYYGPFSQFAQDLFLGCILCATLAALEACRRRMRPEYFAYAALVILLCLSTPENSEPLWSYDRFALTMFPLWMVGGAWLSRCRGAVQVGVLLAGAVALAFYTMQFSSWAFIA